MVLCILELRIYLYLASCIFKSVVSRFSRHSLPKNLPFAILSPPCPISVIASAAVPLSGEMSL